MRGNDITPRPQEWLYVADTILYLGNIKFSGIFFFLGDDEVSRYKNKFSILALGLGGNCCNKSTFGYGPHGVPQGQVRISSLCVLMLPPCLKNMTLEIYGK